MNHTQKQAAQRTAFVLLGALLLAALGWYLIEFRGSGGGISVSSGAEEPIPTETLSVSVIAAPPGLAPLTAGDPDGALGAEERLAEPEFAYKTLMLTFGGLCVPASPLGSEAYGTFVHEFQERGGAYFFRRLSDLFWNDDFTVLGCGAVFTDNSELEMAEKEDLSWYRAPTRTAGLFAAGGVDCVALGGPRLSDYGSEGIADTRAALTEAGVRWADGAYAVKATLDEGVRVAVWTYPAWMQPEEALKTVAQLKQDAAFLAVYVPGAADADTLRAVADAGADLVIAEDGDLPGTGGSYQNSTVVTSLGTLLDGSSRFPTASAALIEVECRARDGVIAEKTVRVLPARTYDSDHPWSPVLFDDADEEGREIAGRLSGDFTLVPSDKEDTGIEETVIEEIIE